MRHEEILRLGIGGEMKPLPPGGLEQADPGAAFVIESANATDAPGIVALLEANRADPSIFLRPIQDVRSAIEEFVVARDAGGGMLGCAALHAFTPECAEILTVAVSPEWHGRGAGGRLTEECLRRARGAGHRCVWLATLKPEYFGRFGFRRISRWSLPAYALLSLLRPLVRQPVDRWWNTVRGAEVFMQIDL
jgi:amino-acid N-acetyltransferase